MNKEQRIRYEQLLKNFNAGLFNEFSDEYNEMCMLEELDYAYMNECNENLS